MMGRLLQDGQVVAEVSGPDRATVEREVMHYALMYGQDGPVRPEIRVGRRWVCIIDGTKDGTRKSVHNG